MNLIKLLQPKSDSLQRIELHLWVIVAQKPNVKAPAFSADVLEIVGKAIHEVTKLENSVK